ncbi:MAG: hypothetical protein ACFFDW_09635 [Candidatus Thorarchaeota archaeon]
MSNSTPKNTPNSPIAFSVFDAVTLQFKRNKTLGLVFSLSAIGSFLIVIILLVTIGPIGLIVIIPMPFFIFFAIRFTNVVYRTGANNAYKKVVKLLYYKDTSALVTLSNLSLKDDQSTILPENYFLLLFSIAALVDLDDPTSSFKAMQFYKKTIEEKIKPTEAVVLLKALAQKEGKDSFTTYITQL